MLEAVAGTPFQRDLTLAFTRLEKMLSPRMRQFLDRLPHVLGAKPGPRSRGASSSPELVAKLLEATLHHRVAQMKYNSISSGRTKEYIVPPYRLAFAQGGLYLLAFVPEYMDVRTFAVDRIASVSLDKQTFTPTRAIPDDVFANSLGVNTGPPSHVEIAFDRRAAPYVRTRVWHPSQALRDAADGGVVLSLEVCNDLALRSWILGWGSSARVLAPAALAADIRADLTNASAQYRT
jgi:predicted DNA-binding transcriptional regulator YafY